MYSSTCDFCNELTNNTNNLFSELLAGQRISRVIAAKGELRLVPSLGEIIPGHMLIVPTYHVTSSTLLTPDDKTALRDIFQHVQRIFVAANGQCPTAFEHGDPTGSEVFSGQCVSHAHIHILPTYVDMLSILHDERRFLFSALLSDDVPVSEPYLSIIDGNGWVHYFSAVGAPRQYLRALYAKQVGQHDAQDWYRRIDMTKTLESLTKYAQLFKNVQ